MLQEKKISNKVPNKIYRRIFFNANKNTSISRLKLSLLLVISKANIKQIRSLQQKKFREKHKSFVIEGYKMLEEAIQHNPDLIETVYTTEPESLNKYASLNVETVSSKELSQISSLKSPQPYVTICKMGKRQVIESSLEIALDTIQDPGNLGTILRLAAWFNVKQVILSAGSVDIYNPKVIQASMGAIFTVNIVSTDLKEFLSTTEKPVYGAVMEGENVYKKSLPENAILLMGNEGNGIHESLFEFISNPISIPKIGSGESLNVAMATGILLSEFKRV